MGLKNMQRLQTALARSFLSDHMPFVAEGYGVTLLGWNILCQMLFNEQYEIYNNGFICPNESDEHYANRLSHIAAQLNNAAIKEKPDFICLQECPETLETRDHLISALKQGNELKHYEVSQYNNDNDEYYLMTLYDGRLYNLDQDKSEKLLQATLNEGLKGRISPLVFTKRESSETILVVNVHANFSKEVQADVRDLYQYASELGICRIVLLGDFNRDLVLVSDDYSKHDICQSLDDESRFAGVLYVNAVPRASFCSRYDKMTHQKSQVIETRDGLMSTFPVVVSCLAYVNTPNVALSFTKNISPRLSTIPSGFLEQLELEKEVRAVNAVAM